MTVTTETSNNLTHSMVVSKGKEITDIRIRLNDECKNGHEEFSVTATIYELRGTRKVDVGGGCCHDHILSLRPDLQPFVDLHLCTWQGVPMHCIANAFYWLAGYHDLSYVEYHGSSGSGAKSKEDCLRIFRSHVRCTDDELPTLLGCRSKDELAVAFEDLGIIDRWKAEGQAAIRQLEEWTGKTFESRATRGHWKPVSQEARAEVEKRRREGYYEPAAVAERDKAKAEGDKQKKREKLIARGEASIAKIRRNLEIQLEMLDRFGDVNYIYYDHTNEVAFNWTHTEKLVTKEEFESISKEMADWRGEYFPDGVKFRFPERPKY